MKCHYEVLGISLTASSDDIKKAYRKLALEWHPDKNLHRSEEAKEVFQLLQQAYEILSDPQERAWYDRHREEILHAGFAEDHKNDTLDVYQYFNTSCYKGFGDDEKSFYSVYREVFSQIASEDKAFREDEMEIPMFGSSTSSYEEVVHNFYAYWQSYCTAKTFAWVDAHNLSEARKVGAGRQVIRMMEKENKKLRDNHKKLRNEEVRQLVQFVRKRDKRVQAHKKLLEEQNAEKAKKSQEHRKKQLEERQKNLQNYQETDWASMSRLEDHFSEIENNLDQMFGATVTLDEGEGNPEDDLYCVACDKDFRSAKAKMNHENSKKHKENVVLLKHLMKEEEENDVSEILPNSATEIDELDEQKSNESDLEIRLSDIPSSGDELPKMTSKKQKKKKKSTMKPGNYGSEETDLYEEDNILTNDSQVASSVKDNSEGNLDENYKEDPDENYKEDPDENYKEDPDENYKEDPDENYKEDPDENYKEDPDENYKENPDESPLQPEASEPTNPKILIKKRKTKGKDAKKNNKTANIPSTYESSSEKLSMNCERCLRNFESRNKLFEHLKTSGHAIYLGETSSQNSSNANEKTSKNRRKR